MKKTVPCDHRDAFLHQLKSRFEANSHRHSTLKWEEIASRLEEEPTKLWSLYEMENTGGEPDVIGIDRKTGKFVFCDCVAESPKGRRSLCYDREALNKRKEHKPVNCAMDVANAMGIELMTEEAYFDLQKVEKVDTKTSSWLKTPDEIRKLGGAIFGDLRYGRVFIYHNGADSYYAVRGFRGMLRV